MSTPTEKPKNENDYILVGDKNSRVLAAETDYVAIKKLASLIRKGGGEVTIFKAIKG